MTNYTYSDFDEAFDAVQDSGYHIKECTLELRNSSILMLEAIKEDFSLIKYASQTLKKDKTFALKAVHIDFKTLYYLKPFQNDEEVVLEAISNAKRFCRIYDMNNSYFYSILYPSINKFFKKDISMELKNNVEFVKKAMNIFPDIYYSCTETIQNDKGILKLIKKYEKEVYYENTPTLMDLLSI